MNLPEFIPDAVFASDNQYEIPTLDLNMQAEYVEAPVKMWGQNTRRHKFTGTYGFYVKDYKFTALWKHPDSLLKTGCSVAIEPNFSTSNDMPRIIALYGIFQKRWIARFWQMYGVRIIVDLNISQKFLERDALLGVPAGWGSFATRAQRGTNELLSKIYEIAYQKARGKPRLFLVYGGGQKVQTLCQEQGWLWIPEQMSFIGKEKTKTATNFHNLELGEQYG